MVAEMVAASCPACREARRRALAGTLDDEPAREMREAVEECCEWVDPEECVPTPANRLRRFAGSWSEEEFREFEEALAEIARDDYEAARRRLLMLYGRIPEASAPPRRR
jgi:hypothetical protein